MDDQDVQFKKTMSTVHGGAPRLFQIIIWNPNAKMFNKGSYPVFTIHDAIVYSTIIHKLSLEIGI